MKHRKSDFGDGSHTACVTLVTL